MKDKQYNILIVDDNKLFLKTISSIIKSELNCIIFEAEESSPALKILQDEEIDLVLLDINLPGIDGFETAKLIKSDGKTSNLPIIFMTGFDPEEKLREIGFDIGAVDYLIKPFNDLELIRLLRLYFRFIEHEKLNNSKLIKLNLELEEEIERRKKIELALTESEKQLKETISMKDKFFSIIAHDLKNPLGAFKELTKIMIEEYENLSNDDFKDLINDLNKSSNGLYELLQNLLEWSRSQLGKIPFNPSNFNLSFIVKQNVELLSLSASKKKIDLSYEIDDNLVVNADINMVTTILRNLISNAIKFTPENGKISVYTPSSNEKHIEISVLDSGIGIKEEDIEKLFRIDSQHTTLGTNNEKGTGLGLVLCKDFIEKNGGNIRVESVLNKGTEFVFTLSKGERDD